MCFMHSFSHLSTSNNTKLRKVQAKHVSPVDSENGAVSAVL